MWAGRLACFIIAMAAAEPAVASAGNGTGSIRSWEMRCAFKQPPAGAGRQGMHLADYVNYASTDTDITGANWHMFGKQALSTLGKEVVDIFPHPDRVQRHSNTGRHKLHIR
jgi:hypothetical protein